MIYRSILIQLDLYDPIEERVRYGRELAERFEAELIGFAARDAIDPALVFAGGAVADPAMTARMTDEIVADLAAVGERFLTLAGSDGRATWRGLVGNPNTLLARESRAADLVVVGPVGGKAGSVDPGEAVLALGRPVLLPSADLQPVAAKRVVVAWKDTREARRAVADALPLLTGADEVAVVTVEERHSEDGATSAADVVRFLVKHGVKARAQAVAAAGLEPGEAIAAHAIDNGADLVVSGGFGHSRLREWLLGGATRSLIGDHRLNRLMSN